MKNWQRSIGQQAENLKTIENYVCCGREKEEQMNAQPSAQSAVQLKIANILENLPPWIY